MTRDEAIKKYLPLHASPEDDKGNALSFEVTHSALRDTCADLGKKHMLALANIHAQEISIDGEKCFKVLYTFIIPKTPFAVVPYIIVSRVLEFPSVADILPVAMFYEPHVNEMFGLTATGSPSDSRGPVLQGKRSLYGHPMRNANPSTVGEIRNTARDSTEFLVVGGEGISEVPVGPVHAGIIEPGHFRFSMAGEEIVNLEPMLGWVHKGSEKLFETLPLAQKLLLSERIAGDTSFAHSSAYLGAVEELAAITVPERAKYLRVIYAEFERLTNHLSDIGFILSDTGFNFGGAQCGILRETMAELSRKITGSRYLRGVNTYGGVIFDLKNTSPDEVRRVLDRVEVNFAKIIEVARGSTIIENRLNGTGRLSHETALDLGAVGVSARASGIHRDARIDCPYAAYGNIPFDIALEQIGDVAGRFWVRVKEVYSSLHIIRRALTKMPDGEIHLEKGAPAFRANAHAVGVTEGWRGEIVYFISTDRKGEICRVSVRDPSFINWNLVPHAAIGNVLPDFPLINKSFNLSYTGHDR